MKTDVLVVGGGLAGAAAAWRLAREGAQVMLLERERVATHKVCGEFLSMEALFYLQQIGIEPLALGAVPLTTVRFAGSGSLAERALPFPAMSLTRRRLDAELLLCAERAGVHVRRGCSVEALEQTGTAWRATLANGEAIVAETVFAASGKHDLRGHRRPPGRQQGLVAFKMYWRLRPEELQSLGQAVELFTYPDGYAGLQPVEDGFANLCCLVRAEQLRRITGKWQNLVEHMGEASPRLRRYLCGAQPQLAKPLTIASIPYGFVRRSSAGLWHIGDQAVVIPSFTGDGMSLALHTGMLAASMYLQNQTATGYQHTLARQVERQVRFATVLSKALVRMPRAAARLPQVWPGALTYIARHTRIGQEQWSRVAGFDAVAHTSTEHTMQDTPA